MPKWLFWLALFFVLFLIYTQPADAGNVAGGFAGFAVDLLSSVGEFLTGLFEGASNSDGSQAPATFTSTTVAATEPSVSVPSTFTHTHDGLGLHSHP